MRKFQAIIIITKLINRIVIIGKKPHNKNLMIQRYFFLYYFKD
jgi:hypothetical protein